MIRTRESRQRGSHEAHVDRKLVLDVDETLFNSVRKHVAHLTDAGRRLGWKNLPTYEDVLIAGGTHSAYGHFPGYWEINEAMRNAPWFNSDLEVIEEAQQILRYSDAMVAFYLTTRPENLTEVTHTELTKYGFPDREVVCRPDTVPLENTTPWKLSVLAERGLEMDTRLVMVDDSISLHKAIKQANLSHVGSLLIAGPMTPRGNGAVHWDDVLQRMKQA